MKSNRRVVNFYDIVEWKISEKNYQANKDLYITIMQGKFTGKFTKCKPVFPSVFFKGCDRKSVNFFKDINTRAKDINTRSIADDLRDFIKVRFSVNLKINRDNFEKVYDMLHLLMSREFHLFDTQIRGRILLEVSRYPDDIPIKSISVDRINPFSYVFDDVTVDTFDSTLLELTDVVWPRPSLSIDFTDSIFFILLNIISVVIPLLIGIAYFTLAERKIMASIQRRRGPNVVGYMGLFQPLADGFKLFVKETILPTNANLSLFIIAPIITFVLSLISWSVIPFGEGQVIADLQLGILYSLAISSLGVYGVLISGWSSNSKYAFLGGLRSAAQMVSYEIPMGFIIVIVILCVGSANLSEIVLSQKDVWLIFPLLPLGCIFFICCLAETNRHPFDLPEAEAELVSGYNVEYSAMGFALFFLGEYANMLLMSAITSILFLGGWLPFWGLEFLPGGVCLGLKVCLFVILFIWIRAILPRYRYDQLMKLGWKCFLPLTLSFLFFIAGVLVSFNWLPN